MKRTARRIHRALRWAQLHWLECTWLAFAGYALYTMHVFVSRFLAFSWFLFETIGEMQKSGTLS